MWCLSSPTTPPPPCVCLHLFCLSYKTPLRMGPSAFQYGVVNIRKACFQTGSRPRVQGLGLKSYTVKSVAVFFTYNIAWVLFVIFQQLRIPLESCTITCLTGTLLMGFYLVFLLICLCLIADGGVIAIYVNKVPYVLVGTCVHPVKPPPVGIIDTHLPRGSPVLGSY